MRLYLPHKQALVRVVCLNGTELAVPCCVCALTACFAQHSAFHQGTCIMRQILLTEILYLVKTRETES